MTTNDTTIHKKHLVLGGARSGKSHFAESLIVSSNHTTAYYLATAEALDDEMGARILRHQNDRKKHSQSSGTKTVFSWQLIEEPLNVAEIIIGLSDNDCVLIECLTLWISNCLHHGNWPQQKSAFIDALRTSNATVVMVSNEVGHGVVPMDKLSRKFVDESGWLHQELAQLCDKVSFVTAGLAQTLK